MRDADVRRAVRKMLDSKFRGDKNTRIVEEMGIWAGTVRIDVAVINGQLHGLELKSMRDNLARLPDQAKIYSQVFDRMTLVTAENHLAGSQLIIPEWWGIIIACHGKAKTTVLKKLRSARRNRNVDALQLSRLLWRAEALNVLHRFDLDKGFRSGSSETLAVRLASELPLKVLQNEIRQALKHREDWLGQPVQNEADMSAETNFNPNRSISRRG